MTPGQEKGYVTHFSSKGSKKSYWTVYSAAWLSDYSHRTGVAYALTNADPVFASAWEIIYHPSEEIGTNM